MRGETLCAAESCTAGLVSSFLGKVPGASKVLWGSFVVYTVDAKVKLLDVPNALIEREGAVSRPVALAMAEGALAKSSASWAFSITGLAGPSDGSTQYPAVGTVWIAVANRTGSGMPSSSEAKVFQFEGSRIEVQEAAAVAALQELLKRIG